jgi:ATP-dependent protease ClpP protease subunit
MAKYDPYDSEGFAAVKGRDLIYSGDVTDRLWVFLCDNLKDKECRRLFLSSLGGYTYVMSAIIDLFEDLDDLTTYATGVCMSAAVPIIAAGTPGKRYATHRTRFLLHPGWDQFQHPMKLEDLQAESEEMAISEDMYAKIMHRYCTHTLDWWRKKLSVSKNWYFDVKTALDLGIIDHIVPDKIGRKIGRSKKA